MAPSRSTQRTKNWFRLSRLHLMDRLFTFKMESRFSIFVLLIGYSRQQLCMLIPPHALAPFSYWNSWPYFLFIYLFTIFLDSRWISESFYRCVGSSLTARQSFCRFDRSKVERNLSFYRSIGCRIERRRSYVGHFRHMRTDPTDFPSSPIDFW